MEDDTIAPPAPPLDLGGHGRRYAFEYPPDGNSDHLPMALLALTALGAPESDRQQFAAAYLPRLLERAADDPAIARQRRLLAAIDARGIEALVADELPPLVSGWYRGAYHPLIRLAYGVEFQEPEEVAAGLAYMADYGPSPRVAELAALARPAPPAADGLDLLAKAAATELGPGDAGGFDDRAESVLAHPGMPELALVLEDNLRSMSAAALAALDASHHFFALHLVTASHAFRIVQAWAGPHAQAILNLGLLAGYGVVGAPPIPGPTPPPAGASPTRAQLLALCREDEHDFKLAFSAWAQARFWNEPAYLAAAERYLRRG